MPFFWENDILCIIISYSGKGMGRFNERCLVFLFFKRGGGMV